MPSLPHRSWPLTSLIKWHLKEVCVSFTTLVQPTGAFPAKLKGVKRQKKKKKKASWRSGFRIKTTNKQKHVSTNSLRYGDCQISPRQRAILLSHSILNYKSQGGRSRIFLCHLEIWGVRKIKRKCQKNGSNSTNYHFYTTMWFHSCPKRLVAFTFDHRQLRAALCSFVNSVFQSFV